MVDVTLLNTKNLLRLADAVEAEPQGCAVDDTPGFDMNVWDHTVYDAHLKKCGTCRCIGGMADVLFGNHDASLAAKGAAFRLEVIYALDQLFFPQTDEDDDTSGWNATPKQAAAAIRYFAETGKVDWDRAMAPTPEVDA